MVGTVEPDLEAIAALRPDVILDTRSSGERQRYEQLAKLGVPVVAIPDAASAAYLTPWQDQLTMIGTALGRADRARELHDELTARFAAATEAHPAFRGATVVVGARSTSGYGAFVGGGRVEFMEQLGFVNSPAIEALAGEGFSVPVSQERMDLLDADLTVMFTVGLDISTVTDDPLYRLVPSVRAGRHVPIGDRTIVQAFSGASVTALSYAFDRTVPLFADAMARPR